MQTKPDGPTIFDSELGAFVYTCETCPVEIVVGNPEDGLPRRCNVCDPEPWEGKHTLVGKWWIGADE